MPKLALQRKGEQIKKGREVLSTRSSGRGRKEGGREEGKKGRRKKRQAGRQVSSLLTRMVGDG